MPDVGHVEKLMLAHSTKPLNDDAAFVRDLTLLTTLTVQLVPKKQVC